MTVTADAKVKKITAGKEPDEKKNGLSIAKVEL